MRRSTLLLGLTVTAGVVVTAGSGWWATRSAQPEPVGQERRNDARMRSGASALRPMAAGETARTAGVEAVVTGGKNRTAGESEVATRAATATGAAIAVQGAEAGQRATGETGASSSMPWLQNFAATAESAMASPGVVDRMARWRAPDAGCSATAYGGLAITAEVAPARGAEEVLASYTQGVLVLDAAGQLVASATAPVCQGSADEIDAIAAGDAHIDGPVIALAVTTGGHRASTTWLVLYRVAGGVVAPVFSAAVEEHADGRTRSGEVTLLPGALLYRTPAGRQTLWTYSVEQQRYEELALVVPPGV